MVDGIPGRSWEVNDRPRWSNDVGRANGGYEVGNDPFRLPGGPGGGLKVNVNARAIQNQHCSHIWWGGLTRR